jgi:hypothetical protein
MTKSHPLRSKRQGNFKGYVPPELINHDFFNMANGGRREGAGRKSKVDEERVRTLAISAIAAKYGSEEAGFTALLDSGEASLIKFVFEHAFGKPTEKHEHSGNPKRPLIFKLDGRFKAD